MYIKQGDGSEKNVHGSNELWPKKIRWLLMRLNHHNSIIERFFIVPSLFWNPANWWVSFIVLKEWWLDLKQSADQLKSKGTKSSIKQYRMVFLLFVCIYVIVIGVPLFCPTCVLNMYVHMYHLNRNSVSVCKEATHRQTRTHTGLALLAAVSNQITYVYSVCNCTYIRMYSYVYTCVSLRNSQTQQLCTKILYTNMTTLNEASSSLLFSSLSS